MSAADSHPYPAITDFFNCTFKFSSSDPLEALFSVLFGVLGEKFAPAIDRQRGLHGYQKSFQLGDSSAIFAVGGQAGTAYVSLPGAACALIADWLPVVTYLRDTLKATVTRWDGAVDDYLGTHTVDHAVDLFLAGQFTAGGNMPSCNQHGNWIQPDGSGRIFYVGKRKNGKMLRVYEKGMQLGGEWHPWVRWEVELHNKDRIIPWEVLLEPGRFSLAKRTVYITDEVCSAIYAHASEPLRDAMDLAYLTGQRPADTLRMTAHDIIDGHLIITQEKTKQPLRIVIRGALAELLERIAARKETHSMVTAALLTNTHGKRLTAAVLRNHFDKARLAAAKAVPTLADEIKNMWFYDLRAKAADDTADGLGDEAASNLLGHEDMRTTRRHYLRRGKIVAPTK